MSAPRGLRDRFNYTPEHMIHLSGTGYWVNDAEFNAISDFMPLVTRPAYSEGKRKGYDVAALSAVDDRQLSLYIAMLRAYDPTKAGAEQ